MKLLFASLLLLTAPLAAQTIAPSQIKPGSDGQVLKTTGGKAVWSAGAASVSSVFGRIGDVLPVAGDYNCAEITGAVCSLPSLFNQTVKVDGTAQTQRPSLNFINGAAGTVSCVDNPVTSSTDCTFTGGTSSGITYSIADVTGSRAVNTAYQNTSSAPMFIQGSVGTSGSGTGNITVAQGLSSFSLPFVGPANQATATVSGGDAGFSATIMPGYWYIVQVSGAVNGGVHHWTQITSTGSGGGGGGGIPYPSGSGIPVVAGGTAWGTTVAAPSGAVVGTTDIQTLTNKNIAGSEVNSGVIPVAQIPVATGTALGAMKPDGTSCTVSAGVLTCPGSGGYTPPTGTGLAHITSGTQDSAARAVDLSNGDVTGTLAAAREPAHTGDVTNTAGSLVMTLATVNSSVGNCGDATHVPQVTLNAKGLTTACTAVAITGGGIAALTGDVTASGTGSVTATVVKVDGVAYGASPGTNTVPVVTGANTVTYEAVPNAALAHALTTVNGSACTLGSSCTVIAAPSGAAGGALAGTYPNPTIAGLGSQYFLPASNGAGDLAASNLTTDSTGNNLTNVAGKANFKYQWSNPDGLTPDFDNTTHGFIGNSVYHWSGLEFFNTACGTEGEATFPGDYIFMDTGNKENSLIFGHLSPCSTETLVAPDTNYFMATGAVHQQYGTSIATITNVSLTSNVVTIIAANSFSVGQYVQLFGLTTAPFLNLQRGAAIISASSVQFTFAFTHADVSSSSETGNAEIVTDNVIRIFNEGSGQIGLGDGGGDLISIRTGLSPNGIFFPRDSIGGIYYGDVTSGQAQLSHVTVSAPLSFTGGTLACASCVTSTGIANTTISLGSTLVPANTCTSPATATMTGVTTASTFTSAFASNPNAVPGWGSSGGLVVTMWPTANTLNWSVCNQTSSSITPGAMTLNVGAR